MRIQEYLTLLSESMCGDVVLLKKYLSNKKESVGYNISYGKHLFFTSFRWKNFKLTDFIS